MPSTAHPTASPCHHAVSGTCAHPPCNPEHHVEWPARAPVISGRPCRQQPHQHANNACGQAASANAKRQISRGRIRAPRHPPPPPRVTHAMPACFCAATKRSCSRQPRTPHRSNLTAVPAAVGMPSQYQVLCPVPALLTCAFLTEPDDGLSGVAHEAARCAHTHHAWHQANPAWQPAPAPWPHSLLLPSLSTCKLPLSPAHTHIPYAQCAQ